MRYAGADGLNQEPHGLARHRREPLYAKYVVGICERRHSLCEHGWIGNLGQWHNEAIEIVVVMLRFLIMERAAVRDVILGAYSKAEQGGGIDLAVRNGNDLDRARHSASHGCQRPVERGGIEEIALVKHHEIGASDLVFEDFLHWIIVIERWIGGALTRKRFLVPGNPPLRYGCAVDHRHHAIDRDPAADCRPVERLDQRLGQRQAGSFDHDVLYGWLAGEDRIESR